MHKRSARGFTLLELMIVVAVVAILSTLAFYNYSRYGYRARRADGREMLMRVASAQERYYTNFNQYASSLTAAAPTGLGFSAATSEKGYYTIATANGNSGDTQTYKLTATPLGIQLNDVCGPLNIDNVGNKTPSAPSTNGNCW